jgi:hypothetical protein
MRSTQVRRQFAEGNEGSRLACEKRLASATLAHGVHQARHAQMPPCAVSTPTRPFFSWQVKRRRHRNRVRV